MSMDRVSFRCEIETTAAEIQVDYTVVNESGRTIGLFNRVQHTRLDDTLDFSPHNVYADIDGSELHLQKRVLPLPEGLSAAETIAPFVTRLENGQAFRERFLVLLPARACNPMRRAQLAGQSPGSEIVADEETGVDSIRYSLGAFVVETSPEPGTPEVQFTPVLPTRPDILRVWPPGLTVGRERLLTRERRLEESIPALQYRVVPPRDSGVDQSTMGT